MGRIHQTAIVDPQAEVADDAEVQAYSVIGPHVRIGARTVVGPHCVVDGWTTIGEDNRFFSGAQIGVVSQDMKHRDGCMGRLEIGDRNLLREHVTVSASTVEEEGEERRATVIGNDCLLMACAHVGHDSRVGDGIWIANCSLLAGHVTIEDCAKVSALVAIHQDCVVGRYSFVGGMSRINQDVPPFMLVEGNPCRCHGPNKVGLQRSGFNGASLRRIKGMYRLLYRSRLNTTQALARIGQEIEPGPERDVLTAFIHNSKRGILR